MCFVFGFKNKTNYNKFNCSLNDFDPVPGGLTVREVLTMFQELNRVANIVGFELTEVNPSQGQEWAVPHTQEICRRIIACVFGSC